MNIRTASACTALLLAGALIACTTVQTTPDAPASSSTYPPPDASQFPVDSVYDGDTLRIFRPTGESVQVRVLGIDAPEVRRSGQTGPDCYGKEARDAARAVLQGKSVSLQADLTQDAQDRYGRLLAYVQLPEAGDLGELLLYGGYARVYNDFPVSRTPQYRTLEADARAAARGGWAPVSAGGCGWTGAGR